MKITKNYLHKLIIEEIAKLLSEEPADGGTPASEVALLDHETRIAAIEKKLGLDPEVARRGLKENKS